VAAADLYQQKPLGEQLGEMQRLGCSEINRRQ